MTKEGLSVIFTTILSGDKAKIARRGALASLAATASIIFLPGCSEGFEKWDLGPVLDVKADTPSRVIAHQEEHTSSSTVFDEIIPEIEIEQQVKTAEGIQTREGWVQVSSADYDAIHDGDTVIVQKVNPDWSNDLLTLQTYHVIEVK